jgi:hypothetical protein
MTAPWANLGRGRGSVDAASLQRREGAVERDAAQRDDNLEAAAEEFEFGVEEGGAGDDFLARGFIVGRGAAADGGDQDIVQAQAVVWRSVLSG